MVVVILLVTKLVVLAVLEVVVHTQMVRLAQELLVKETLVVKVVPLAQAVAVAVLEV
jgi:hypothetical protein